MSSAPTRFEDPIGRLNENIRDALITGIALTIPLMVTLLVFGFVVRAVSNAIEPVVLGMNLLLGIGVVPKFVLEIFTLVLLFWFVLAVGFVANTRQRRGSDESRLAGTLNDLMSSVPGLGSVYMGVKQMSEVVLSSDSESFRAVKIVEFPHRGAFMLCFVTAIPPPTIREAVAHSEMVTVFVPLAPNPVMGGFLTYVPEERVYDIDLTIEEGMRAIMTSGVAMDPRTDHEAVETPDGFVRQEFGEGVADSDRV